MLVTVPVSVGELCDKISILKIKLVYLSDSTQESKSVEMVRKELQLLEKEYEKIKKPEEMNTQLDELIVELKSVNQNIWDVEDRIRICEKDKIFDDQFIQLARNVYIFNDNRAKIKKEINILMNSSIVEIKSYEPY